MINKIKDIFYVLTHIKEIKQKLQILDGFKDIFSSYNNAFLQIEKLLYNNCEIRLFCDNNKIIGMFQDSNNYYKNKSVSSDSLKNVLHELASADFNIFSEDYQAKELMEDMIELDANCNIINDTNYKMPQALKNKILKDAQEAFQKS